MRDPLPVWVLAVNATNPHEPLTASPTLAPLATPVEPGTPGVRSAVFVDPASCHLLALAQRVAQAEVTTLLVGPTGAGKEVLARVLHEASPRARGPFVALNCAAMPEHLIEDLLFGHEKGAFTGAHRDHKGLFEQAQGGTLFLDEIGEMPMLLQSKLLRVLQERQLTRLGGQGTIALDVRVVAATNKDLRQAMAAREFREDLYYRIATFRLQLLALNRRPGDILPLALQCLAQHARPGQVWHITGEAQQRLVQYGWPGNVRELENVMRRAMVLCPDAVITPAHLLFDDWLSPESPAFAPATPVNAAEQVGTALPHQTSVPVMSAGAPVYLQAAAPAEALAQPALYAEASMPAQAALEPHAHTPVAEPTTATGGLHSAVRQNEHQIILAAIAAAPSRMEAARRLGISPRTLRYKLAQLRDQATAAGQALSPALAD
jgi:two-component system, response regulator FlrC